MIRQKMRRRPFPFVVLIIFLSIKLINGHRHSRDRTQAARVQLEKSYPSAGWLATFTLSRALLHIMGIKIEWLIPRRCCDVVFSYLFRTSSSSTSLSSAASLLLLYTCLSLSQLVIQHALCTMYRIRNWWKCFTPTLVLSEYIRFNHRIIVSTLLLRMFFLLFLQLVDFQSMLNHDNTNGTWYDPRHYLSPVVLWLLFSQSNVYQTSRHEI